MMSFIWPVMLIALALVPLLVGLYFRLQQRRRQLAAHYGSLGFVQTTSGSSAAGRSGPGLRRHLPPGFFVAGITILLVSLARPQAAVSLPSVEGTVIMAFDVSGSMVAEDFAPNRLEAAKNAARDFVLQLPSGVKAGIVVFSDGGFAVLAPTNNQDSLLTAIDRLAPQRGTSLGQGVLVSLNTIAVDLGENPQELALDPDSAPEPGLVPEIDMDLSSAVIVLLSDGENNMAPDPLEVASLAKKLGVRVYTVGIGSPAGTTINIDGFAIHTRLDETTLQAISQVSGGEYFNASDEEELRQIYGSLVPKLVIRPEKLEITALFVGAGLVVLLLGGLFSLLWFGRVP